MVGEELTAAAELTAAVGEGRAALALLVSFIQRSAWNKNSANFAFWGFSEVRQWFNADPSPTGNKAGMRVESVTLATSSHLPYAQNILQGVLRGARMHFMMHS
jgi:hypothetical protein